MEAKTKLNNIFFDPDRTTFFPTSNVELNKLFSLLSINNGLDIELSYSIDGEENNKYNSKLAMLRTQAIIDYLAEKGIHKERMTAKEPEKLKESKPKDRQGKKDTEAEKRSVDKLELKIIANK